nr:zinc finger protein 460-like [Parasteatoda tepidariorum]
MSGNRCAQCDKNFTTKKSLYRHQRSIHGNASYQCAQCNKNFNRKDALSRHVKFHCHTSKRNEPSDAGPSGHPAKRMKTLSSEASTSRALRVQQPSITALSNRIKTFNIENVD